VLKIGGILRIIVPDLKKVARAYVNNDKAFFKKALGESEKIRLDLGLGGQLMNILFLRGKTQFYLIGT
jgi:predicted SAM-dependent methyltransferase